MKSPIKYFGSDGNTADRINALFPEHETYIEPFAGSLATLLAHPGDGRQEIVNDIDPDLINFWKVVQSTELFPLMYHLCKQVKHNLDWWKFGNSKFVGEINELAACKFIIRYNFSRNGNGETFAPSNRIRNGLPEYDSRWQLN
jgi:site-specific DNA-adenine methylase